MDLENSIVDGRYKWRKFKRYETLLIILKVFNGAKIEIL